MISFLDYITKVYKAEYSKLTLTEGSMTDNAHCLISAIYHDRYFPEDETNKATIWQYISETSSPLAPTAQGWALAAFQVLWQNYENYTSVDPMPPETFKKWFERWCKMNNIVERVDSLKAAFRTPTILDDFAYGILTDRTVKWPSENTKRALYNALCSTQHHKMAFLFLWDEYEKDTYSEQYLREQRRFIVGDVKNEGIPTAAEQPYRVDITGHFTVNARSQTEARANLFNKGRHMMYGVKVISVQPTKVTHEYGDYAEWHYNKISGTTDSDMEE